MTIKVKCLLKSRHVTANKFATTFELYYPRAMLHEEFMTHRALSRNASSSRAIPVETFIKQVKDDPALPEVWGVAKKGMADGGPMTEAGAKTALGFFLDARDKAIAMAQQMLIQDEKPHKQIINILLRPWEHITVVTTATEWSNFFALRRDAGAKPEFRIMADMMWKAYQEAEVQNLKPGEWHLPYIYNHEIDSMKSARTPEKRAQALDNLIRVSAARCARTSYRSFAGKPTAFADDIALYDKLVGQHPVHASPTEHQCTPDTFKMKFLSVPSSDHVIVKKIKLDWDHPELHGNFVGFNQHRKTLPGENVTDYDGE
jgi:thymidylate synthase ThyX